MKEKLNQTDYKYIGYSPEFKAHILEDKITGNKELWFANKNHASYGIIYENTYLEFLSNLGKVS
jgi:hypothetical protein